MIVVIVIVFLLIIVILCLLIFYNKLTLAIFYTVWLEPMMISNFRSWEQMSNSKCLGGKSFVGAANVIL